IALLDTRAQVHHLMGERRAEGLRRLRVLVEGGQQRRFRIDAPHHNSLTARLSPIQLSNSQVTFLSLPRLQSNSGLPDSGFIGGGQLGYNWQAGNWVYGLEADFDGASAKSSVDVPDAQFLPNNGIHTPLTTNAARELDWLGTFRGRVGFTPAAPLLLFATGGLAVGQHKLGIGITDPTAVPPANLFNQTS